MSTALPPPPWLLALQQRLLEVGGDFASFGQANPPAFDPAVLAERYRRLFMPPDAGANPAGAIANSLRRQRANQALGEYASLIAADAFARFNAALAASHPALPPITSLRALHALWIDCGEAAYAAIAGTEAYAEAQAEMLAAMLE